MNEIKREDRFLCIKDFIMEDDTVAYKKGKVYESERTGCLIDEQGDYAHIMELDEEFFKHFERSNIGKKVKGIRFEGNSALNYSSEMDSFIDATGVIVAYFGVNDSYLVEFEDGYGGTTSWRYPKELIDKQLNESLIEPIMEKDVEVAKDETTFKRITDSIADLLEYKNEKYGNSALEPLEIFGGKTKVGTRLDDKLARIKTSTVLKKNDVADLIGYLVLICKENGWYDFSEFKD